MKEYEVFIEDVNPCGGSKHAKKQVLEIEAESPESYVLANGRFPILEKTEKENGDVVLVTGDGQGYFIRYTFSEF